MLNIFNLLCCVIILVACHRTGKCELFVKAPSNVAYVAGRSVLMHCSTGSSDTFWYFGPNKISSGSQISDKTNRAIESPSTGEYNLLIRSVRLEDAGSYTCAVFVNAEEKRITAELIVLESDPVCTTASSRDNFLLSEFEFVHLNCAVNYRGNWAPTMRCYFTDVTGKVHNVTDAEIRVGNKTVRSSVSVNMTAQHNGARFTCITYFNESNKPSTTTANNVPLYRHEWMSEPYSVQYFARPMNITDTTGMSQFSTKLDGNLLTCVADGSPLPTYRWVNISTNNTIHVGAVMQVCKMSSSRPEELDCEATNTVFGVTKSLRLGLRLNATAWNEVIQQCPRGNILMIVVGVASSITFISLVAVAALIVARNIGCACVSKKTPDIVESSNANQRMRIEVANYSDVSDVVTNVNVNHGSVASVANIRQVEVAYCEVFELDRSRTNINGSVASIANLRDADVENNDCFYADVRVVRNAGCPPRPPRLPRGNQETSYAAIDHRIGPLLETRQQ